jgi:hypothetical protein
VSSGILQVHGWHLALMISVLRLLSVPFFHVIYTLIYNLVFGYYICSFMTHECPTLISELLF